ncbi:universal stress protein [Entomomonas asaccharolytica]|uniref:Universal stress protein n=1 Tax=Entomomonas asaccharolytica TaxID=2785331 RepID=A0A974RWG6_9GAMM|nr:universal stress protein [Entomomonas asaccharolytica]QQP85191.1 universal stress protein [Entomomonas asaccharolytica]
MFSSVLIAIDGWEYTTRLLDLAKRICVENTKVEVIYVDNNFTGKLKNIKYLENSTEADIATSREQVMQDALCYLKVTGDIGAKGTIVGGDTADVIIKYAKKINCDLILMGHRHLSKLNRFFDPSITIKVVKKAHCPVLVDSLSKLD